MTAMVAKEVWCARKDEQDGLVIESTIVLCCRDCGSPLIQRWSHMGMGNVTAYDRNLRCHICEFMSKAVAWAADQRPKTVRIYTEPDDETLWTREQAHA